MTAATRETWNVTIDGVRVATVELPGSDQDWSMITRYRDMLGGNAVVSSAANDNGTLISLIKCGIGACSSIRHMGQAFCDECQLAIYGELLFRERGLL